MYNCILNMSPNLIQLTQENKFDYVGYYITFGTRDIPKYKTDKIIGFTLSGIKIQDESDRYNGHLELISRKVFVII